MSLDRWDVGALSAIGAGAGSVVAVLNEWSAEYAPLVGLLAMVTGVVALGMKVWMANKQIQETRRQLENRREHEKDLAQIELERERVKQGYGRRHDDPDPPSHDG